MSKIATCKTPADLKAAYRHLDKPIRENIDTVYNLHGDLHQLLHMTYVAKQLPDTFRRALFIVDDEYYEDAVNMLTKHFGINPQDEEWVNLEHFTVILGGTEDRHARKAGGKAAEQYKRNSKGAIARVLDVCLNPLKTFSTVLQFSTNILFISVSKALHPRPANTQNLYGTQQHVRRGLGRYSLRGNAAM
ncbi:MAG: hypothetical protein M1836_001749 [Candelina mexicana]|nr:MAG: hypothetical protein M1836_001749 [Candelina mexicana]